MEKMVPLYGLNFLPPFILLEKCFRSPKILSCKAFMDTPDSAASVREGGLADDIIQTVPTIIDYFFIISNNHSFLGPRGPLVLPLIGPARPSVRAKNLDHLYTGIYAL